MFDNPICGAYPIAVPRLKAELDDKLSEVLRRIASQTGYSEAEVIKRALALYDYSLNVADPAKTKTVTIQVGSKTEKLDL